MRPTVSEVIEGIAFSLRTDLAEEVQSAWGKRVLLTALGALEYLKRRWEHEMDIVAEENRDLSDVLDRIRQVAIAHPASLSKLPALASYGEGPSAASLTGAEPSGVIKKMEEQNRSLRASLAAILEGIDGVEERLAGEIRQLAHAYIQRQKTREGKLRAPLGAAS